MPTNTYETLLILDSNHYARDPSGVSKKIETMVSESGGKILVSRMWMEQRLAYPIDGHQKGTYWLAYFEMQGPDLTKLKRALEISEPVLRELTIKLDPRLVEPILANARGETLVFREPDAEPEASPDGVEESVAEVATVLD